MTSEATTHPRAASVDGVAELLWRSFVGIAAGSVHGATTDEEGHGKNGRHRDQQHRPPVLLQKYQHEFINDSTLIETDS